MKAKGFDYLKKITAIDYTDRIEVVYLLYSTGQKKDEVVMVKLPSADPSIGSVVREYPSADWHEREMSEMFGIKINGRMPKRLLLELWNGSEAPLRKSFVWGKDYKRIE